MKKIIDYKEVSPLILKYLKRGVITNNFLSPDEYKSEIEENNLFYDAGENFLNIYLKRSGFYILYFYLLENAGISVPDGQKFVCEAADNAKAIVKNSGFSEVLTRVQLERKPQEIEKTASWQEVYDEKEVHKLMLESFNQYSGYIPTLSQILKEGNEGHIITAYEDNKLAGILRWGLKGKVAQIKHLCVRKDIQRSSIGKKLCSNFLTENGDKKCIVWTGKENIPALHLYESFGFLQNGLKSTVYMKG